MNDNEKLDKAFFLCCNAIKNSTVEVNDIKKLLLYGLFKQAKNGDCNTDRPLIISGLKEQYKWDSWNNQKNKTSKEAKQEYIKIVKDLLKC